MTLLPRFIGDRDGAGTLRKVLHCNGIRAGDLAGWSNRLKSALGFSRRGPGEWQSLCVSRRVEVGVVSMANLKKYEHSRVEQEFFYKNDSWSLSYHMSQAVL